MVWQLDRLLPARAGAPLAQVPTERGAGVSD